MKGKIELLQDLVQIKNLELEKLTKEAESRFDREVNNIQKKFLKEKSSLTIENVRGFDKPVNFQGKN